jgi:hypothetical protein
MFCACSARLKNDTPYRSFLFPVIYKIVNTQMLHVNNNTFRNFSRCIDTRIKSRLYFEIIFNSGVSSRKISLRALVGLIGDAIVQHSLHNAAGGARKFKTTISFAFNPLHALSPLLVNQLLREFFMVII